MFLFLFVRCFFLRLRGVAVVSTALSRGGLTATATATRCVGVQWQQVKSTAFPVVAFPVVALRSHTTSLAFRHRPPNSAIIGYATQWPLLISAHLSADAISPPPTHPRLLRVSVRLWK